MPDQNEVRQSKDGRTVVWNGSQWMFLAGGAPEPGRSFMPANPDPNPSVMPHRTNLQDMEMLKSLLTGVGALAPLALAPETGGLSLSGMVLPAVTRMGLAALGGAGGRALGHGMIAGTHSPNQPDQPSLGEDVLEGGMYGATQEAAPLAIGPALKYGGKGLQGLAGMLGMGGKTVEGALGGSVAAKAAGQGVGMGGRAFAAHEMGLGPGGVAAATIGPPIAKYVGTQAERAGTAMGTRTLSQHIDRLLGRGGEEAGMAARGPRVSSEVPGSSYRDIPLSPPAREPQPFTPEMSGDTGIQTGSAQYGGSRQPTMVDRPTTGSAPYYPETREPTSWFEPQGQEPPSLHNLDQPPTPEYSVKAQEAELNSQLDRQFAEEDATQQARMDEIGRGSWSENETGDEIPSPPAPVPALPMRQIPRGDEFWGPGSKNRAGFPAQADESRRLIYDPQTDTGYLRMQLGLATDPAEREFLANAIQQRYKIGAGAHVR